jgi:hypothetical protein
MEHAMTSVISFVVIVTVAALCKGNLKTRFDEGPKDWRPWLQQ